MAQTFNLNTWKYLFFCSVRSFFQQINSPNICEIKKLGKQWNKIKCAGPLTVAPKFGKCCYQMVKLNGGHRWVDLRTNPIEKGYPDLDWRRFQLFQWASWSLSSCRSKQIQQIINEISLTTIPINLMISSPY